MFAYLVVVAIGAPAPPAPEITPQKSLTVASETYAKVLIELLDKSGEKVIAVGPVTNPFGLATGSGVEAELVAALEALRKDVVAEKANHEVRGEIAYRAEGKDETQKVVLLKLQVIDTRTGKEIPGTGRVFSLASTTDMARLVGISVRLAPKTPGPDVYRQFSKAAETPQVVFKQTKVKTSDQTPWFVEILAKKDGKYEPQQVTLVEGKPVVKLAKGDVFAVKLNNPSDSDIGCLLYVDGISGYHFAERGADGRPFASIYHVPPKNGLVMMGWTYTPRSWDVFRVGPGNEVKLPPSRESKYGSVTVMTLTMRPNPNGGRLLPDELLDYLTIRLDR